MVRGDQVEKLEFKSYLNQVFNYDLTWRQSINQSVLASHPGYLVEPLDEATRKKLNLVGRMAFRPLIGPQSPAWKSGVRPDRIIVTLGASAEDLTPHEFYFSYRIRVVVGGKFKLTILDNNGAKIIRPYSISILDLPPEAIQMMKDRQ